MNIALQTNTPLLPSEGLKTVDPIQLSLHETIEYALEGEGAEFRLKLAKATGRALVSTNILRGAWLRE